MKKILMIMALLFIPTIVMADAVYFDFTTADMDTSIAIGDTFEA